MKYRLILLLILLYSITKAQNYDVLSVEFRHTGDDAVGTRLAYNVREEIRDSKSMNLTYDDDKVRMQLILVTLEPGNSNSYSTVYSATWVWNNPEQPFPFYITSVVGTCGTSRVSEVAQDLVAQTDKHLNDLRRLFNAVKKNKM